MNPSPLGVFATSPKAPVRMHRRGSLWTLASSLESRHRSLAKSQWTLPWHLALKKGEVLTQCPTWRRMGRRVICPFILNPDTRSKWVVSFIRPGRNAPDIHWIRIWVVPRACLDIWKNRKVCCFAGTGIAYLPVLNLYEYIRLEFFLILFFLLLDFPFGLLPWGFPTKIL